MRNFPVLKMALPFPVMAPVSSTVLLGGPLLENFHLVQSPNWQSVITGTGRDSFRTISSAGLCHFWYGRSLGPVPELGSMCVVPFQVLGSSISATVVVGVPYQNWTLWAWSHFVTGLCQFRYGHSLGPVPELASMCMVSCSGRAETLLLQSGGRVETLLLQSVYLNSFMHHIQKTKNTNGQHSTKNGISHFRYWYHYWKWECHFQYW